MLKSFYTDIPPKKFVALFCDGAGAELFYEHDNKKYTQAGESREDYSVDKNWFLDAGFVWFIPLPENFEVWGER